MTLTFREDHSNVGTCPDPFLLPRTKGLVPRLSITLELIFCAFSEEETLTVYALGSN